MYKGLNVHSEIGTLRKVMMHRPGEEMTYFGDQEFDRVWFHDALYLKVAQKEHDAFAQLMRDEGVEVLYLEDLLGEALDAAPQARAELTDGFMSEAGLTNPAHLEAVRAKLDSIEDNHEFASKLIHGVRTAEIELPNVKNPTLAELESGDALPYHLVDPMPSIYFSRDSFAVIGSGVSISHMYWKNRNREPLFGQVIFTYHPEYAGSPILYSHDAPYHIEGGDILNINATTLAIGLSERTEASAIDTLAQNILWGGSESLIETIYALKIPRSYAFMHLDTVFTQVDYDKFTIYPGIVSALKVYRLTRGAKPGEVRIVERDDTIENMLKEIVGVDHVKLIECGGGDRALASREQWNDGSNTMAIAPGVVAVYERNEVTNDLLYREGLRLLEVPSAELSRGRGGPRCMTMPFWREEI